jgi:serine/threonine protein kinase
MEDPNPRFGEGDPNHKVKDRIHLVYEYAQHSVVDLAADPVAARRLKGDDLWKLFLQTSEGMQELHRNGIVHGNLKPPNLLLDWKCRVKICDAGQIRNFMSHLDFHSCWLAGENNHNFLYLAPESALDMCIHSGSEKMDVYSFGILVWELCFLSAEKWYSSINPQEYIRNMSLLGDRPPIPGRWPERIRSIIEQCLLQGQRGRGGGGGGE